MLMGEGAFEGAMFELPLGYGPKHVGSKKRKLGVKGTLRIGCYLREFKSGDLEVDPQDQDGGGGGGSASETEQEEEAASKANQKYTLYCQVYHANNIKTKGMGGHIGECLGCF